MSRFEIKNWCPGALRPMQSGDGLVVRVRPRGSKLTPEQALGIAEASAKHGNGLIDLTARGNLQLRGVEADRHDALIVDLKALRLVDDDVAMEGRRNIIVTPFRDDQYGVETAQLAADLEQILKSAPELPSKFGFAVDTGTAPVLSDTSADIRLERSDNGSLIVRADGAEMGAGAERSEAPQTALELAKWFVQSGGVHQGRGRMANHVAGGAKLPDAERWTVPPAAATYSPRPGPHGEGFLVAAEFGQLHAEVLGRLATMGTEIRVTPWRMLFLVGAVTVADAEGLITDACSPWLNTSACTGSPGCLQGLAPTRDLARALAPFVPEGAHLHVSGCAKGCAHPAPASVTLCATRHGFDLIRDGRAADNPSRKSLQASQLMTSPQSAFEVP